MFLKKDEIIYKLKTKDNIEEFKDETDEHREYPIAIMIDEGSASASEVFTAALKEKYGAIVIGETSFGKGKVQKAYNLSNGALVKYTFQEWLTPNGNFIDQVGITPDIEVKYEYNPSETYDTQIKKAIEEMSK
jgi:carboxyl-terminal processing protease